MSKRRSQASARRLVAATFLAPTLAPHALHRPRLHATLDPKNGGVVAVVAPAGSGKTTLVRSWLAECGEPSSWINLEHLTDGSPSVFWQAMIQGCQALDPRIGLDAEERLADGDSLDHDLIASLLADIDSSLDRSAVLVLDDLHAVADRRSLRLLGWFLDNRPDRLRVVVTARSEPLLPLARWRVRGQVAEVRWSDLRFDLDESDRLLARLGDELIGESDRRQMSQRIDGWAAGLQLAGLAMRRSVDPVAFVERFDGTERTIADFLFAEVLDQLPEQLRRFLRETSILAALAPDLCEAVTGRTDSRAVLEQLYAAQLFIVGLDGNWYRYHTLFADLLFSELHAEDPGAEAGLHRRASHWYADAGDAESALQHAHRSGDHELLLETIVGQAPALFARGRVSDAVTWLRAIPNRFIDEDPARARRAAVVLGVAGLGEEALVWVDRIESRPALDRELRAECSLAKALVNGSWGDSAVFAERRAASECLGGTRDPNLEALARVWRQRLATITDDGTDPYELYRSTAEIAASALAVGAGVPEGALAVALAAHGRLTEALREAEVSLAIWTEQGEPRVPGVNDALRAAAIVALEAGRLDDAERLVEQGLGLLLPDPGSGAFHLLPGAVVLADVSLARWMPREALERLDSTERSVRGRAFGPELLRRVDESTAIAAIELGDLIRARRAVAALPDATLEPVRPMLEARLLLASGRSVEALELLGDVEANGRRRRVELELLRARAATGIAARRHVALALDAAGGEPMGWTFSRERNLASVYAHPEFAGRVPLLAVGDVHRAALSGQIVEQLTDRELRILRLLPTHLSNKELAGELYVSLNTVKTHLKAVYRKLGVDSRSDAVRRARELGLLGPSFTPSG